MKATELTIDVNAKLIVSDETAERCLRILEMWQADNPSKFIDTEELPNGTPNPTIQYYIRDKKKGW